jgi:hypothetical protein
MPPAKTNGPAKQSRGQDGSYTRERADTVLTSLEAGQPLKQSAADAGLSPSTVRRWVTDDRDGFAERYARARLAGADAQFDELHEWEREVLTGNLEPNSARVAIDSRKWRLSKMRPERYSDRQQVDHHHTGHVTHEHGPTSSLMSQLRGDSGDTSGPKRIGSQSRALDSQRSEASETDSESHSEG